MSIPNRDEMRAAAVVVARRSGDLIARIIDQLRKLPVDEICVVCCGPDERTSGCARRHGAKVVEAPPAASDGAAISAGAAAAMHLMPQAEMFLCADGRFVYPAKWLSPYLRAVSDGADVVLNDISSIPIRMGVRELCSAFLNCASGVSEAGPNSLAVLPFALSRRAVERIGLEKLASLPSALLAARLEGLRIESVGPIPTPATDRRVAQAAARAGAQSEARAGMRGNARTGERAKARPGGRAKARAGRRARPVTRVQLRKRAQTPTRAEALELDEYLAALAELIALRGPRGSFGDCGRRRDLISAAIDSPGGGRLDE